MIKINLASKKKSSLGGGRSFGKPSLDLGQFKDLPLGRMIVPVVVCVAANLLLNGIKDSELAEVEAELTQVQAEKPRLEAEAQKLKAYEDLRKTIEADEATLRNKLKAIQTLVTGRGDTEKILRDLSNLIPHDVWLTDFQMREGEVKIKGLSTDFDPILDFQKLLNGNANFSGVEAKNTAEDRQKRLVTFEIDGQRKKASP